MDFQRHEIACRRRHMHRRHAADRTFRHVQRHLDAVVLRHVADLFRLQNAARRQHIRMHDGQRAALEQRFERLLQIHVFACAERHRRRLGQTHPLIRKLPWNGVFHPCQIEFLQTAGQFDAVLQRNVAEMVDGDRNLITSHGAAVRHVLLQEVQSFLRQMDARERMRRVEKIIRLAAHGPRVDGSMRRRKHGLLVFAHLLQEAQRGGKRSGHVHEQFNAKIHF